MACLWLALFAKHLDKFFRNSTPLCPVVNVQKNHCVHAIYYTSVSCRPMSIALQEREEDFQPTSMTRGKYFTAMFYFIAHWLRENFEVSLFSFLFFFFFFFFFFPLPFFFLSRIRGVILFCTSPYHEKKKTDTA